MLAGGDSDCCLERTMRADLYTDAAIPPSVEVIVEDAEM
jgi:hypothetical protein